MLRYSNTIVTVKYRTPGALWDAGEIERLSRVYRAVFKGFEAKTVRIFISSITGFSGIPIISPRTDHRHFFGYQIRFYRSALDPNTEHTDKISSTTISEVLSMAEDYILNHKYGTKAEKKITKRLEYICPGNLRIHRGLVPNTDRGVSVRNEAPVDEAFHDALKEFVNMMDAKPEYAIPLDFKGTTPFVRANHARGGVFSADFTGDRNLEEISHICDNKEDLDEWEKIEFAGILNYAHRAKRDTDTGGGKVFLKQAVQTFIYQLVNRVPQAASGLIANIRPVSLDDANIMDLGYANKASGVVNAGETGLTKNERELVTTGELLSYIHELSKDPGLLPIIPFMSFSKKSENLDPDKVVIRPEFYGDVQTPITEIAYREPRIKGTRMFSMQSTFSNGLDRVLFGPVVDANKGVLSRGIFNGIPTSQGMAHHFANSMLHAIGVDADRILDTEDDSEVEVVETDYTTFEALHHPVLRFLACLPYLLFYDLDHPDDHVQRRLVFAQLEGFLAPTLCLGNRRLFEMPAGCLGSGHFLTLDGNGEINKTNLIYGYLRACVEDTKAKDGVIDHQFHAAFWAAVRAALLQGDDGYLMILAKEAWRHLTALMFDAITATGAVIKIKYKRMLSNHHKRADGFDTNNAADFLKQCLCVVDSVSQGKQFVFSQPLQTRCHRLLNPARAERDPHNYWSGIYGRAFGSAYNQAAYDLVRKGYEFAAEYIKKNGSVEEFEEQQLLRAADVMNSTGIDSIAEIVEIVMQNSFPTIEQANSYHEWNARRLIEKHVDDCVYRAHHLSSMFLKGHLGHPSEDTNLAIPRSKVLC